MRKEHTEDRPGSTKQYPDTSGSVPLTTPKYIFFFLFSVFLYSLTVHLYNTNKYTAVEALFSAPQTSFHAWCQLNKDVIITPHPKSNLRLADSFRGSEIVRVEHSNRSLSTQQCVMQGRREEFNSWTICSHQPSNEPGFIFILSCIFIISTALFSLICTVQNDKNAFENKNTTQIFCSFQQHISNG